MRKWWSIPESIIEITPKQCLVIVPRKHFGQIFRRISERIPGGSLGIFALAILTAIPERISDKNPGGILKRIPRGF